MSQTWRNELKSWANQYALEFGKRKGVLGVVIGGSLARGQEWRHSDLELGILVEEKDPGIPYFNIDHGRGVEVIQLALGELEEQVRQVDGGDLSPILTWPIQLWLCRVMDDPSGLMARFKSQFDAGLFQDEVIGKKIEELSATIQKTLGEARELLAQDRPAAGLVRARSAMNEAILVLHWKYHTLPRSQNRTDSRLRLLCRKHSTMPFYDLYWDVFELTGSTQVIRSIWPLVKEQVMEITRLWGDSARDFFLYAVDSNFAWRQNAGISTVYRLYIPVIGGPEQGLFGKLDDRQWAAENKDLMAFLGLTHASKESVSALAERIEDACHIFESNK